MSKYMHYIVLNDGRRERVSIDDADPFKQAYVIDRTLLPVLHTGQGWTVNRKITYSVRGEIHSSAASFVIYDYDVQIAVLAVSLRSKSSAALWRWLHEHAHSQLPEMGDAPSVPWAALRYDVHEVALPPWIDGWAQQVGCALLMREGW